MALSPAVYPSPTKASCSRIVKVLIFFLATLSNNNGSLSFTFASSIGSDMRALINEESVKANYGLKKNSSVEFTSTRRDGKFSCEKAYTLHGKPIDIFSADASYIHNELYYTRLPNTENILQQENRNEVLTYKTNSKGEVEVAVVMRWDSNNLVANFECPKLGNRYALIRDEDYDYDMLNQQFSYDGDVDDDEVDDNARDKAPNTPGEKKLNGEPCKHFRQIDLAVVYDSSFCAHNGGTRNEADEEAMFLVQLVSNRYQQNDLCLKLKISHLEGYCDEDTDPYKAFVDLHHSGCGKEHIGLMDEFQKYWNENRNDVFRDTAHFLSGTKMEPKILGCAKIKATCKRFKAYGVSYATYTSSYKLLSNLIAHEIGHNNGLYDQKSDSFRDNIIYYKIREAQKGFHTNSIKNMTSYLDSQICVERAPTQTPTLSPTQSPTRSPYPTQTPSKCRRPFLTLLKFSPLLLLSLLLYCCVRCICSREKESSNDNTNKNKQSSNGDSSTTEEGIDIGVPANDETGEKSESSLVAKEANVLQDDHRE